MRTYAVLLRGINVGGINIRMAELRAALTGLPQLENVSTLLASGNVLCDSEASASELKEAIEQRLREHFGYDAWVVLLPADRLVELIDACPFPADSAELHAYLTVSSDVSILDELFDAAGGFGNDRQVRLGPEAIAWQVEVGATLDSAMNKLVAKPRYKHATTTRNLRTMLKIAGAAAARP